MNEYDKRRSEAGAGGEPDLFSPVQYSQVVIAAYHLYYYSITYYHNAHILIVTFPTV